MAIASDTLYFLLQLCIHLALLEILYYVLFYIDFPLWNRQISYYWGKTFD